MYGEEEKAFRILQEEIIKQTPDWSIFAWKLQSTGLCYDPRRTYCGVLAETPSYFSGCGTMARTRSLRDEFSVTNNGVDFDTALIKIPVQMTGCQGFFCVLPLHYRFVDGGPPFGIKLRKVGENRFQSRSLATLRVTWSVSIRVRRRAQKPSHEASDNYGCSVRTEHAVKLDER